MFVRVFLSIVGLLVVVGALGAVKVSQFGHMFAAAAALEAPPEAVTTESIKSDTWNPTRSAVGTLVADQMVVVGSETPGRVVRLNFESGQVVKKGELLVSLDTSIERAQLASAQAAVELAKITLVRTQNLGSRKVRTQAQLDQAEAEFKRAEAQTAQIRAQIAKKTIRAPFDGKLGIREVDLGEIVASGQPLVSLQSTQSLFVDFYLPQQDLVVVKEGQLITVVTDAHKERKWLATIVAVEPSVEVSTRNLRVRAKMDNQDFALRPGMFVQVKLELSPARDVRIVPETAVMFAPYGNTIFVVEDGRVRQLLVDISERKGDFVAVEGAVEPGMEVVTGGAFKLRNGVTVTVNNSRKIGMELDPKPEDR